MTREGAVEVNAATGKKKRISKRIRDADFAKTEAPPQPEQAAQPLPGGATSPPLTDTPPLPHAPGAEREQDTAAAERVLERIDGARTRKASKKAARKDVYKRQVDQLGHRQQILNHAVILLLGDGDEIILILVFLIHIKSGRSAGHTVDAVSYTHLVGVWTRPTTSFL